MWKCIGLLSFNLKPHFEEYQSACVRVIILGLANSFKRQIDYVVFVCWFDCFIAFILSLGSLFVRALIISFVSLFVNE